MSNVYSINSYKKAYLSFQMTLDRFARESIWKQVIFNLSEYVKFNDLNAYKKKKREG